LIAPLPNDIRSQGDGEYRVDPIDSPVAGLDHHVDAVAEHVVEIIARAALHRIDARLASQ
jgi:hypothetical protein